MDLNTTIRYLDAATAIAESAKRSIKEDNMEEALEQINAAAGALTQAQVSISRLLADTELRIRTDTLSD
jgi:hypothetical protein